LATFAGNPIEAAQRPFRVIKSPAQTG